MLTLPKWIDAEMPFRGPCALCGAPDARHRVTDAIWEAWNAGDSLADVARDFSVSERFVFRGGCQRRPPRLSARLIA